MKKLKVVYLIPTYNERDNILPMLTLVNTILSKKKTYDYTILVIDDNSPDGTGKIVTRFKKNHLHVVLLTGPKKGLGVAMIKGYKYAIKSLSADVVVSNESDFSYNPIKTTYMIRMIEEGQDVVLGSRRIENTNKWALSRRLIHFIANTFFARIVAGVTEVEDHNSAFKAIRVKGVLDKIDFNDFPKGFSFFNYLTFRLSQITPNIYEFKTTFKPRTAGVSKMMLWDGIEYIKNCLRIRYEKIVK